MLGMSHPTWVMPGWCACVTSHFFSSLKTCNFSHSRLTIIRDSTARSFSTNNITVTAIFLYPNLISVNPFHPGQWSVSGRINSTLKTVYNSWSPLRRQTPINVALFPIWGGNSRLLPPVLSFMCLLRHKVPWGKSRLSNVYTRRRGGRCRLWRISAWWKSQSRSFKGRNLGTCC